MLLGWVIEIITRTVTYNEKDLFHRKLEGCVNRGILLASLARKTMCLSDIPSEYGTGLFYCGGLAQLKTHTRQGQKFMVSSGILLIWCAQAPNNELVV